MGNCIAKADEGQKRLSQLGGGTLIMHKQIDQAGFLSRVFIYMTGSIEASMDTDQFIQFFAFTKYQKLTLLRLYELFDKNSKNKIGHKEFLDSIKILANCNVRTLGKIMFSVYREVVNKHQLMTEKKLKIFKEEHKPFLKKTAMDNHVITEEEEIIQTAKSLEDKAALVMDDQYARCYFDLHFAKEFNLEAYQKFILKEKIVQMERGLAKKYESMDMIKSDTPYYVLSVKWWEKFKLLIWTQHKFKVKEVREKSVDVYQKRFSTIDHLNYVSHQIPNTPPPPEQKLEIHPKVNMFRLQSNSAQGTRKPVSKNMANEAESIKIDNSSLVGVFEGELAKNLLINEDYLFVTQQIYKGLEVLYGGGPPIQRYLIKGYFQLYPLFLRQFRFNGKVVNQQTFKLRQYSKHSPIKSLLSNHPQNTIFYYKNIGQTWRRLTITDKSTSLKQFDFHSHCFLINMKPQDQQNFKAQHDHYPPQVNNPTYGDIFILSAKDEMKEVCVFFINNNEITLQSLNVEGTKKYVLGRDQLKKKLRVVSESIVNKQDYNMGGLINLGNTCYINASISLLFFNQILDKPFKSIKNIDLASSIYGLIAEIKKTVENGKVGNPHKLKKLIGEKMPDYAGDEQHDAHEFMIRLIDYCQAVEKKFTQSPKALTNLLNGELLRYFECTVCGFKRNPIKEPLKILSIPIKQEKLSQYQIILRSDTKYDRYTIRLPEKCTLAQFKSEFEQASKLKEYRLYEIYKHDIVKNISALSDSATLKQLYIKPSHQIYAYPDSDKNLEMPKRKHSFYNYKKQSGEQLLCQVIRKNEDNTRMEIIYKDSSNNKYSKLVTPSLLSEYPNPIFNKDYLYIKIVNRDSYDSEKIGAPTIINVPQWLTFEQFNTELIKKLAYITEDTKGYTVRLLNDDGKCYICQKYIWNQTSSRYTYKYCLNKCKIDSGIPIVWIYTEINVVVDWQDIKSFNKSIRYNAIPSLKLEETTTVDECLNSNFQPETLQMDCERCKTKLANHAIQTKITSPKLLILHVKRFSFEGDVRKISTRLAISQIIDISKYTVQNDGINYELAGFICHEGTGGHRGHYTSVVKREHQWWLINDLNVRKISLKEINEKTIFIIFYTLP